MTRPKIRACSISDPFILILREDDTLGLFVGEAERCKIRRKDMSALGEKVSTPNFSYKMHIAWSDTSRHLRPLDTRPPPFAPIKAVCLRLSIILQ